MQEGLLDERAACRHMQAALELLLSQVVGVPIGGDHF